MGLQACEEPDLSPIKLQPKREPDTMDVAPTNLPDGSVLPPEDRPAFPDPDFIPPEWYEDPTLPIPVPEESPYANPPLPGGTA